MKALTIKRLQSKHFIILAVLRWSSNELVGPISYVYLYQGQGNTDTCV